MKTEIKKVTTNHENVSKREVNYDVYVNGEYQTSFADVLDAMDYVQEVTA
jgi:hypothetical protein